MSDQRLTELEKRQADLERRINELEKLAPFWPKDGTPAPYNPYPDYPVPPWLPIDENPVVCHICGIRARDGMFYSCNNTNCPSRVIYCATDTSKQLSFDQIFTVDKTRLIGGDIWGGQKPPAEPNILTNNDIGTHPSVLDGLINADGTRKLPLDGAK